MAFSTSTQPTVGKGMPLGMRSPSFVAFLRRNSMLSMPIFSASSSMTLSTAKAAWGEPGAR